MAAPFEVVSLPTDSLVMSLVPFAPRALFSRDILSSSMVPLEGLSWFGVSEIRTAIYKSQPILVFPCWMILITLDNNGMICCVLQKGIINTIHVFCNLDKYETDLLTHCFGIILRCSDFKFD